MKLLKFFVGISLVAASDGYQERQIEKYLERNVKKVTRNVGWDLLFAAGESNQNKGKCTSMLATNCFDQKIRDNFPNFIL